MKLFDIRSKIPEKLHEHLGVDEFRPPQKLAIEAGLFEGENLVVASPTASGKTLVAEMGCANNVLRGKGKAIYLTPLRALASEKYNDFKTKYPFLNVMLSIGDFDSSDPWLQKADIIVCSNEKLDSLIRHGVPWLREIGTVVIDEIHLLDDAERGPTLEILITRLKNFCPQAQLIALSATIHNAQELADWLGAKLVKSDYRPVDLKYGVYLDGEIKYNKGSEKIKNKPVSELAILANTLEKQKQMLMFLSSRRNAEGAAKKCLTTIKPKLKQEELNELEKLSKQILGVLERPTKQCEDLANCVKSGAAFHHAGLVHKQHTLIEEAFRNGLLKLICATPTLAYGCNLPAHTVLVRDLKRFSNHAGSIWLPVLEVYQMWGRAGRPQYDKEGRALAAAKTKSDQEEIFDKYVNGEPEDIFSKLSAEPILRMQILGLVASNEINSKESLLDFFNKTFYAHQYKNLKQIQNKLDKVLEQLFEWDFLIIEGTKLRVTKIGKRVAELYIDPYSANLIIENLKKSNQKIMYYLHTICSCLEMPLLNASSREYEALQSKFLEFSDQIEEPNPWDLDYDIWVRAFKTSLVLLDWIEELGESEILEKYKETPGLLRIRLNKADWLLYSANELANLLAKKEELLPLRKLRLRMQAGAKEELLNLLKFKGIGRIRARKLFNAGIKKVSDVKKASEEQIAKLIGKAIAKKLKEQVNAD